jgi:serine/threonine protein kinase
MQSTDRIKAGFVINDRFEIVKKVGEGGFAMVFEGRDLNLDRQVAIKVLHGALLGGGDEREKDVLERFEREARLAATVDHGSIVKIYDVGEIEGVNEPFIVMEYLRGCSLQDHIDRHGGMEPKKLLSLYQDLLVGLGFAHEAGIVHKDLKPDNIFFRYPGTIRESFCVVDFGIAHIGRNNSRRVTKNGEFFGTPAYMAPEYITDQRVSPSLDVYQMGLILVECLTGEPFLFHEDAMANLLMHLNRNKALPAGIAASPLGPIIERAISQKPELRYQNAMEFAEALAKIDPSTLELANPARRSDSALTSQSTAPGIAPLMELNTGLGDDDSEAAMSWHAEAEQSEDLGSFAFEDTAAQGSRSTKFIAPEVVSDLSEASDIIEEREERLRNRSAPAPEVLEENADIASDAPEPEEEPQRVLAERSETRVVHEADFFEPDPPSNNKKVVGILAALLLMILVAGGVALSLANNQNDTRTPEQVDPGALAANSSETTPPEDETSPPTTATTPPPEEKKLAETTPEDKASVVVQIATVPEGASVFDGETLLGKTPYPVEFESKDAEKRSLVVRQDGYEDLELEVVASGPAVVARALVQAKSPTKKKRTARSNTREGSDGKASAKSSVKQPPKETTSSVDATAEKKTTPRLVLPGQKKPDKKKNSGIVLPK